MFVDHLLKKKNKQIKKNSRFKIYLLNCASDKVLRDKTFNTAKNPKYDEYQRGLTSMVYKFFDKESSGGAIKSEIMPNQRPSDLASN